MNPESEAPPKKVRRRHLIRGEQSNKQVLKRTGGARSVTGSSLDRLCDALLGWELLDDLKGVEKRQTSSQSNKSLSLQKPENMKPKATRDSFSSFNDYLEHWEPLLLMDLRAGVIQGADFIKENKRCGIVHACEAESVDGRSRGTI